MVTEATARLSEVEAELEETYRAVVELTNELERAKEHLEWLSFHDPLTGLPHRRLVEERVGQLILLAARERREIATLMIDLDGFKPINDQYGHDAGDAVLRAVARRLKKILRKSDTVARFGGDEFVALLATDGSCEGAALAAAKLLEAVRRPISVGAANIVVGASIGIAVFPGHGDRGTQLLRNADAAMYEAKRAGGGWRLYDATSSSRPRRKPAAPAEVARP